jgi:murein DD-endopeptidase MepM/ murein hydrolase activator NlpD
MGFNHGFNEWGAAFMSQSALPARRAILTGLASASALAACDQAPWVRKSAPSGQPPATPPPAPPPPAAPPPNAPPEAPAADPAKLTLQLSGKAQQGATLIGRTAPGALLVMDGLSFKADANGLFVMGFDRDAKARLTLAAATGDGKTADTVIDVAKRTFETRRISSTTARALNKGDGPPEELEPFDLVPAPGQEMNALRAVASEQTARVAVEVEKKKTAFASRADIAGFAEVWQAPVKGRITSKWGTNRIMTTPTGVREAKHYGVDIAAPVGTSIVAPAPALVVLAEKELYYEGGCVFLDHGQGLITVYLHLDSIAATQGDLVQAGQPIGTVGAKGRVTGPHLCWRMQWRKQNLDPTLMVGGEDALKAG